MYITSSYIIVFDSVIVRVIVTDVTDAIFIKVLLSTVGGVWTVVLGEREGGGGRER